MSGQRITLDIVCTPCSGTGLYVGLGERNGAAVVCTRCTGTGRQEYTYEPFVARKTAPKKVVSVHVARGYALDGKVGGMPVKQWQPGAIVPADDSYYYPYLYTDQKWCAKPEVPRYGGEPSAPLRGGDSISDCKHWANKAECWVLFEKSAPPEVKRQVS